MSSKNRVYFMPELIQFWTASYESIINQLDVYSTYLGVSIACFTEKREQKLVVSSETMTGVTYPNGDTAEGGYASHIRAHEYFVFKIPANIPSELAAPMMCAGLTTYSPLVRAGCGPGKKVAILGIGGLGHFGILFASTLGAETYAISHSPHKKADAKKLGAKEFICIKGNKDWAKPWAFTFDFILNTADVMDSSNLKDYMSTLAVNGTFHNVGMPDKPLPEMRAQDFCPNGAAMSESHIGNRTEALAMLELASELNIRSWVETVDNGAEGCKEVVERVRKNDARYRFTLVNYEKAFSS